MKPERMPHCARSITSGAVDGQSPSHSVSSRRPWRTARHRSRKRFGVAGSCSQEPTQREANVIAPLADLEAMRGRFAEARKLIAQARTLYDELGQTLAAEANCGLVWGRIELLAGDVAAAEQAFRSSCRTLERTTDQAYLATGAAELADVLCLQQRFGEAEEWCLLASKLAASDDVLIQGLWRATWAKLLMRKGEFGEAEALAREAVALLDGTDGLNRRAKAMLDLADISCSAGRPGEAGETVEAAAELFERKGNIVEAKRARALLAELAVA
jgi:tetratricopeptide (TPR) repeat protein